MFARVPDSMWSIRCDIGCPMVTFVPGSVANCRRSSDKSSSPGPVGLFEADVDFSSLHTLDVLVVLSATSPARRRDHFRLG